MATSSDSRLDTRFFIPFVLQEAVDKSFYDEVISISSEEGVNWAHKLAKKEGIITGISGGATLLQQ